MYLVEGKMSIRVNKYFHGWFPSWNVLDLSLYSIVIMQCIMRCISSDSDEVEEVSHCDRLID